jgi:hypothetical protein
MVNSVHLGWLSFGAVLMKLSDNLPDQSWKAVGEVAQPMEVELYLVGEMIKALGLAAESRLGSLLAPMFGLVVRGFAQKAAAFDLSVAQMGFTRSAQEWLSRWVGGLNIFGKERLPAEGPVLVAANHPGTFDGLAIAAALQRPDLKIVASGNPFFRSLPNVRNYFIYATRDTQVRVAAIRSSLRHLQDGGALLIFPYGRVEPDPLYFKQEARKTLARWSNSLELILRKAPQVKLVFAVNSGFVAPEYLRHPLLHLRKSIEERQILAEFLQVIQQVVFNRKIPHEPGILFSEPTCLADFTQSAEEFRQQVLAWVSKLMDACPSRRAS